MVFSIRRARHDDLPAVSAIYAHAVAHSYATFDMMPPALEVWVGRLESTATGDHFFVAEQSGSVIGFAYSSAYRPRAAYDATRETTVYLDAAAQGQGIGTALYDALLSAMTESGVHVALAVVAVPNEGSERLHARAGFEKAGHLVEVGHKFGSWVDVVIYQRMLNPS